jgi:hypothetical protein
MTEPSAFFLQPLSFNIEEDVNVSEVLQSIKPQEARNPDLVFPDEKTRDWFNECLEAFRIEDYTWHNNRHTRFAHAWRWQVLRSGKLQDAAVQTM